MASGIQCVPIPSGTTASSAFDLTGSFKTGFSVEVASLGTASSVLVAFASTVDSGAWAPYMRSDGSALRFAVFSGTGRAVGVVRHPPSPFGRIELGAAQSATYSFCIVPLPRG